MLPTADANSLFVHLLLESFVPLYHLGLISTRVSTVDPSAWTDTAHLSRDIAANEVSISC